MPRACGAQSRDLSVNPAGRAGRSRIYARIATRPGIRLPSRMRGSGMTRVCWFCCRVATRFEQAPPQEPNTNFPRIYSGACQQKSSELNQLQQTPEQARGKWCVVIECQEESAAPAPAPHPKTHAEIPPPGFSAVKAAFGAASQACALTALNPGGPLAGKGFGECRNRRRQTTLPPPIVGPTLRR